MNNASNEQPERQPILKLHGITKRFPGVLANDHVDLELYPGEVLALLGENGAGKTTLMNVVIGLYRQDAGQICVRGEPVEIHSPRDSAALGIGMIHQNFMLVETMTVAENIVLGLQELDFVPDMDTVAQRINELSQRYNLKVDPQARIWQLSVGEQQRVEILKQLYRGAEILILDEPTAVLTPQEAEDLARVLEIMTDEGKSAIFITHKMGEVVAFSDRVQVLQNGKTVAVKRTATTDSHELARLMVGREVLFRLDKKTCTPGDIILRLDNVHALNAKGLPALRGVSLEIRQGEVLGIAGVAGNGQRQLSEVITGLREVTEGDIYINGERMTNRRPLDIIKSGVSHIPADRVGLGAVGNMAVSDNLAMKGYRKPPLAENGILRPQRILDFARQLISTFQIVTPTPQTRIKFLSGGNVQKSILAREIDACAGLLIAVYPSRGLDVGATESVRGMLLEQRDAGMGVLLISEDLEELLTIADRIAVLFEGEIMGTLPAEEADIQTLGLMMAGVRKTEAEAAAGPE